MLTSHTPLRLVSCSLLLLLRTSTSKESWPPTAGTDSQKALILDAVKTGILRALGLDREPRPTQKASQRDLREMFELYREQLSEMKRNSRQTTTSAVLLPGTGEGFVRKQLQSGVTSSSELFGFIRILAFIE